METVDRCKAALLSSYAEILTYRLRLDLEMPSLFFYHVIIFGGEGFMYVVCMHIYVWMCAYACVHKCEHVEA